MPSSVPNPRVRVPSSGDTAGARRTSRLRSTGKLLPERDSAGRGLLDLGWTGRRLPAFACSLRASGGKQVKGTAGLGWLSKAPTLPPRFDIVWDLYFVTKTCQLCSQTVQANLSSRKHDMDTTMLATLSLSYANMNPDDEMIIMREHEPRMMK